MVLLGATCNTLRYVSLREGRLAAESAAQRKNGDPVRRIMLTVAALSIPLAAWTAGLVGLAGPAGASAPGSCTKVTGNIGIVGGTVTLKGCGGGLGNGSVSLASSPATITWAGHKGITMFILTSAGGREVSRCAAGSNELDATFSVTADTTGRVTVGGAGSVDICEDSAGAISLVKHTVFSF